MPYPLDVAGLHCIIEQLSCPYVIATVKPSKHLIQMPCFYNIISNISFPPVASKVLKSINLINSLLIRMYP